jgi:hypothetical protein
MDNMSINDDIALDIALLELNSSDGGTEASDELPTIIKILCIVVYGIFFLMLVQFGWMIAKQSLGFE